MKQITVNVKVIQLCRFYNRIPHHACVVSLVGIGKQPVLPTHNKGLYSSFSAVVGKLQPAVKQERFQFFFVVQRIIHSFIQIGTAVCRNASKQRPITLQYGLYAFEPLIIYFIYGQTFKALILDENLFHQFMSLRCF